MSRFNTQHSTGIENYAGGKAYSQSPELELISILFTSFAQDQYYRSANDTFQKLKEIVAVCDKLFVAKASVFARTKFGMRSISHVVASELAKHISKLEWSKDFYDKIVYRPDDMTEILSYHTQQNGKISNAMKKGFAKALTRFDKYSLAKYRGEGKGFKLIDVVNLVHPKQSERNQDGLELLVNGKLRSEDTWESELTKAGQVATNDEEKYRLKKAVWIKLIREKKIGYFALLRNLRNILEQAPEVLDEALEMLVDEKLIKNSLVLPFRFVTAIEQFETNNDATKIIIALNKAVDISCNNVPEFDGDSLVVCDYSGSMGSGYNSNRNKGSLFGSIFAKRNNADFMIFGDRADYISFNPMDSTLTILNQMVRHNSHYSTGVNVGHGTNFHSIFERACKKYDRIIIFSDMQGWIGYNTPVSSFNDYKKNFDAKPFIYSFDLSGYGSMQFPEPSVFCLAGFSEKIFDVMKLLEQDKHALIKEIEKVSLTNE